MRGARVVAWAGSAALALHTQAHPVEILVGHTAAGQLRVLIVGEVPVELNVSVFPGFPGWAEAFPGFESLAIDEPAEDCYILPETANIQFTLISADPGGHLWNYTGTAPMTPGQTFPLGNPFFDLHPVWSIDRGTVGDTYSIRVVMHDLSGQFTDSDEVDILLTPEACYANCDTSSAAPTLTANDFQCFLNKFASGDPYANCDGSTSSPALTANDFQCFLNAFAANCT